METRTPCFFIVTPSYNQAKFLTRSIESVLSQTKVRVYLGVFDGGSTDGSVALLKKFGKKVYWISKKDNGQTDALNKGLKWIDTLRKDSNHEYYFSYFNADDYYLNPQVLLSVAEQFRKNSRKKWLVGDSLIVNAEEETIQTFIRTYKRFFRKTFGAKSLKILNPFPQPSIFFTYQAVKDIGKFSEQLKFTMDYEYWLRASEKFGEPIFMDQVLSAFRIHKLSKGGSSFDKQFKEEVQVAKNNNVRGFWLRLHELHAWLTVAAYRFLK